MTCCLLFRSNRAGKEDEEEGKRDGNVSSLEPQSILTSFEFLGTAARDNMTRANSVDGTGETGRCRVSKESGNGNGGRR